MTLQEIEEALEQDRVIDITTIGRKSGRRRRIEIWFHRVDDHIYITGSPGKRDWYANLLENPDFIFHLKKSVTADIRATARPITDLQEKRSVLEKILGNLGKSDDLYQWVKKSPLVEVDLQIPKTMLDYG